MIDDSSLRERIREAMQAGDLPSRFPDQLLGGSASGKRCAVCGNSTQDGVEMELVFADCDAGRRSYYAHPRCLLIFEREIQGLPRRTVPPESQAVNAESMADD